MEVEDEHEKCQGGVQPLVIDEAVHVMKGGHPGSCFLLWLCITLLLLFIFLSRCN